MRPRKIRNWKDGLRFAAGALMLLLGVVGLFLPVLQGVLFLLVAAILLAPYSRTFRRLVDWGERRYPELFRKARATGERIRAKFGLDADD